MDVSEEIQLSLAVLSASAGMSSSQNVVETSQITDAVSLVKIVMLNSSMASSFLSSIIREERILVDRSRKRAAFWETYRHDEDMFKVFGIKRSTFELLLRDLRPQLQPVNLIHGRPEHAVEIQIACGLHYLSKRAAYRTCIGIFGVGHATAHKYVNKVLMALKHTYPDEIAMPSPFEIDIMVQKTMDKFRRFRQVQGVSRVFGAVDGTHIYCLAPDGKREEYVNRHHTYSILMQGLVSPDW